MATKKIYLSERLNIYEPLDPTYYSPGGLPPDAGVDVADWISAAIAEGLIIGAGGSGTFTALSGPITSGTNGGATSITNGAVTNNKLANVASGTFKLRVSAGTGIIEDSTPTQATALLDLFTSTTKGLASAPGTPTGRVLSDSNTWITVAAGGTIDANPTSGSTNAVQSGGTFNALATKITSNSVITGATKTKLTYDTKGLVTAGTDATDADILSSASLIIGPTTYPISTTQAAINSAIATNKISTNVYSAKGVVLSGGTSGAIIGNSVGTNGQVLTADSAAAGGVSWATPSGGGGTANTKYAVTVSGSAGIVARVYGTSGISITKTNASTLTFTIPASGYVENYQVFYPTAENPGSNATHVFSYTSNTITNQGNSTADAPNIEGWFASAVPTEIYHARAVGSSADFVTSITAVGSGNITMLVNFGTTGLSSGDIILKGNF